MRVAFCFYGQLRLLETVRDYYHKLNQIDENIKFDFFISTWNDYNHDDEFNKFTKYELVPQNSIYNSKDGNTQKFTYLLYRVNLLKQLYELENNFKYDLVIILRPDILVNLIDLVEEIKKTYNSEFKSNFLLTVDDIKLVDDVYTLARDFLFIGDSTSVDIHSTMYNFFFLEEKHLTNNMNYKIGGHWVHPYYIYYNNFNTYMTDLESIILRPKSDYTVFKKYLNDKPSVLFDNIIKNRKKYFKQDPINNSNWIDTKTNESFDFKNKII